MAASILPQYAVMRSDSILPIGLAAGQRAVEIDPNLADAHLGLANNLIYTLDWKRAEDHFKRARELEPANATAHQWYGDYLYVIGRSADAVVAMRRAAELDPLSAVILNDLSFSLNITGAYAEAERAARRAVELDPAFVWANGNLVHSLSGQGKLGEARRMVDADTAGSLFDRGIFDEGVALYRKMDGQSAAEARFRKDYRRLPGTQGAEYLRARFHGAARHADSTLYWLDKAITLKEGSTFSGSVPCETGFIWLEADPRFNELLRKMGAGRCQKSEPK
jgi:tetratricopeptide (TPR) repeat protein